MCYKISIMKKTNPVSKRNIYTSLIILIILLLPVSCGNDSSDFQFRIVTTRLPDAFAGRDYYFTLSLIGGTPPYKWQVLGKLPEGIKLDSYNGVLTGSPGENSRTQSFIIKAIDSTEDTVRVAQREFVLKVVSGPFIASEKDLLPLKILSESLPRMYTGIPYKLYLSGSGGLPPYKWNMEGKLPPGMKFDGSIGLIEGTPSETGNWNITLELVDILGNTIDSKKTLNIRVDDYQNDTAATEKLRILTSEIPKAFTGNEYAVYFGATGGTPPYRWETTTDLPSGLELDGRTGGLTGSPETMGDFRLNIRVIDSLNEMREKAYILKILPPAVKQVFPLKILTTTLHNARKGSSYNIALSAQGGVLPYKWTPLTQLPSGLKLDRKLGIITGTPVATGTYEIQIELSDSQIPPKATWLKLNLEVISPEESTTGILPLLPYLAGAALLILIIVFVAAKRGKKSFREPLRIVTQALPPLRAGEPYFAVLEGKGGKKPYLWDNENKIPEGLIVEERSGIIKGKIDEPGDEDYFIDLILYDSSSPPDKSYKSLQLVTEARHSGAEKRVFTLIARDNKIYFEGAPLERNYKSLLQLQDLEREENPFLNLLEDLKTINERGSEYWVVYCKTEHPSGIAAAFKAKKLAETAGIPFYSILSNKS